MSELPVSVGHCMRKGKVRLAYLEPTLQMIVEAQGWGTRRGSPGQYICLKPCTWVQNSSCLNSVQSRCCLPTTQIESLGSLRRLSIINILVLCGKAAMMLIGRN